MNAAKALDVKRGARDLCHLSIDDYEAFAALIGRANYLVPHSTSRRRGRFAGFIARLKSSLQP